MKKSRAKRFIYQCILPSLILISMVFFRGICVAGNDPVVIGLVSDGQPEQSDDVLVELRAELERLLGTAHGFVLPDRYLLSADWNVEQARLIYQQLVDDPAVDIVLAFGFMTGSVIAEQGDYPKPVISVGLIDPEFYGLPEPHGNQSNVHNLTYVHFNQSFFRDLQSFYEVYPYKRLGVVFYEEFLKLKFLSSKLPSALASIPAELVPVPINDSINPVEQALESGVDAIYISQLGPQSQKIKSPLIELVNSKKIPSFSDSALDVKNGIMAGISTEEDMVRLIRRIALNIEAILDGQNVSRLPVNMTFKENLIINMNTVRRIDYSPRFEVLGKAELLNQYDLNTQRVVNLVEVMQEALNSSLDLLIEQKNQDSVRSDISLARSSFFPSLQLDSTGTIIEKETAEAAMGQQAQRSLSGSITATQLIFSEAALGNISIQEHLYKSALESMEQVRRAVILNACDAYFNVLQAKTFRSIAKENVDLTRQNLEIAKMQQATGVTGMGDVYRWESELAIAVTDLIEAEKGVETAKNNLNRILNRPIKEKFMVSDVSLDDSVYRVYVDKLLKDLIDDPQSLEVIISFFVEEGIANSPEIKQLDESIAATERSLKSNQLKRFIPSLSARGEYSNVFDRSGVGSRIPGVEFDDDTWNLAFNLSLPVFSGGSTSIEIRQQRYELEKLKLQRKQLKQLVEFNVRDAVSTVMVKDVNLQASRRSADFASKSLELTRANYQNGTVSIVELISAQNSALNAQSSAMNSVYEYITSMINVEAEVGNFMLLGTPQQRTEYADRLRKYAMSRLGSQKGQGSI